MRVTGMKNTRRPMNRTTSWIRCLWASSGLDDCKDETHVPVRYAVSVSMRALMLPASNGRRETRYSAWGNDTHGEGAGNEKVHGRSPASAYLVAYAFVAGLYRHNATWPARERTQKEPRARARTRSEMSATASSSPAHTCSSL